MPKSDLGFDIGNVNEGKFFKMKGELCYETR